MWAKARRARRRPMNAAHWRNALPPSLWSARDSAAVGEKLRSAAVTSAGWCVASFRYFRHRVFNTAYEGRSIMMTIQHCKTAVAIAALFTASGAFAATNMARADYSANKDRIEADYKADKAACDSYSGNQKDIFQKQAKGKEDVAKAELEYSYTGKASDGNKIAVVKADSAYDVAKEMCDDKGSNAKDVCVAEAKSAHTKALADAKMSKKVGDARMDAADDKRDADYKVATEKCDSLAGDAKSACVSAA